MVDRAHPDHLPEPDAHGQAALLLVESLIHGLAERSVITVRQALDIMEVALDAQRAIADDAQHPSAAMRRAEGLLASLVTSLEADASE